jgi:hypothetical protein
VPKEILEPIEHLAQTMHLSCLEINNISKQTKMIFHFICATLEYHLVCPKDFGAYGTFGTNSAPILPQD